MSGAVLITGASSGFGEACARKFADQGRKLIIAARREQRIEQLRDELMEKVPEHIRDAQKTLHDYAAGDMPRSGDGAMGSPNALERVFGHLKD